MSNTPTAETGTNTTFTHLLTRQYAKELPHLVSAITYRTPIEKVAVTSVDGHRLMLSYHHRKPNSKHADASRTCEISILPNGQSNTSITQIDQAHAIAQLMKKVKPSSSSKAHRLFIEYYQMPRKSVLTSILLLCAYLITIKNTPPTHRPRLFELTYNVLGSTFIACAYYFTLIVHSVEGLMALAICRYRQYSWSTTFLWTLQTLGIGFPGMQLLLKPRPAIKQ